MIDISFWTLPPSLPPSLEADWLEFPLLRAPSSAAHRDVKAHQHLTQRWRGVIGGTHHIARTDHYNRHHNHHNHCVLEVKQLSALQGDGDGDGDGDACDAKQRNAIQRHATQ